tara:strand:+ start:833 stop:2011 length:1179 start_codon:yes stop_codon:yes gene_type:complete
MVMGSEVEGARESGLSSGPARTGQKSGRTIHRSSRSLVLGTTAALLILLGVVMVLSAASVQDLRVHGDAWHHVRRQVIWIVLGTTGLLAMLRVDYRRLRRAASPVLIVTLILLVLVFVPGVGIEANGSSRWIGIGALTLQPSEMAKLAMILYGAMLLSSGDRDIGDFQRTQLPMMVVLGLVGGLVYAEPDMGTAAVLVAIGASLLFFAGLRMILVVGGGALALGVLAALSMTAGYRRDRLLSLFDPWNDPLVTGWQAIQAGVAMSNGGMWGMGLGASRAKWGFLPYAQTDFIFAIVAEELGFVVSVLVVLAFLAIGLVGLRTAFRAPDQFGQLLAAGITTWIVLQAYVNIGAVLGLLPITGIPLPFLSYGGSSMVFTMTAYGVLLNIARQTL